MPSDAKKKRAEKKAMKKGGSKASLASEAENNGTNGGGEANGVVAALAEFERNDIATTSRQPTSRSTIDDDAPLMQQLRHVTATEYQTWLRGASRGRARFFASHRLEALTRVRWWVVPLLWLPLAGVLAWRAATALAPPAVLALAGAGVLLWQFIEYSLHRWLFHAVPSSPCMILTHFLLHGNHHKFPCDVERLVFPPLPACMPAAVIYAALRACLPQVAAAALFAGVLVGYVHYDCVHYLMHSGYLRGSLRARHMHHHHADSTVAFGISSAAFDVLFGTQWAAQAAQPAAVKGA